MCTAAPLLPAQELQELGVAGTEQGERAAGTGSGALRTEVFGSPTPGAALRLGAGPTHPCNLLLGGWGVTCI